MSTDINPRARDVAEYRQAVRELCARFGSDYWQSVDEQAAYPDAFVTALTEAGWLAALIPATGDVTFCILAAGKPGTALGTEAEFVLGAHLALREMMARHALSKTSRSRSANFRAQAARCPKVLRRGPLET